MKLLIWIDRNHDGVSQPDELYHLDEMGIHTLALNYSEAPLTDANGNEFHLKGHLNPDKGEEVDRIIYNFYPGREQ